jgi:hypothetical protein
MMIAVSFERALLSELSLQMAGIVWNVFEQINTTLS